MKIFAILAVLFLIQSVFACPPDISDQYAENEQSMINTFGPSSDVIEAQPNQSIFLQLPSTPGTGYSWNFHSGTSKQSREAVRACQFKRFDQALLSRSPRLGAGGNEIWQFYIDEAAMNAETNDMTISLAYERPWMTENEQPTNTWTVKLRR